jgi:hypothetical protein
MTPPIESFPATELPLRLPVTNQGKFRKKSIDLNRCPLEELLQYNCELKQSGELNKKATVVCEEVVRLFRRLVRSRMVGLRSSVGGLMEMLMMKL